MTTARFPTRAFVLTFVPMAVATVVLWEGMSWLARPRVRLPREYWGRVQEPSSSETGDKV